jgi:hypothetical protein
MNVCFHERKVTLLLSIPIHSDQECLLRLSHYHSSGLCFPQYLSLPLDLFILNPQLIFISLTVYSVLTTSSPLFVQLHTLLLESKSLSLAMHLYDIMLANLTAFPCQPGAGVLLSVGVATTAVIGYNCACACGDG